MRSILKLSTFSVIQIDRALMSFCAPRRQTFSIKQLR